MVTANFLYIKFSLPFSSYFLCFQNFQKSMLFLFCLSYFYEIIRMIKSAHKTRPVRYDTHFIKLNGVCSFQTCDWFWKMNCVLNYAIANIFSAFSALISNYAPGVKFDPAPGDHKIEHMLIKGLFCENFKNLSVHNHQA